jgi:hypothetical protein
MNEPEWVKNFAPSVEARLRSNDSLLSVLTGKKLPYANEIRAYSDTGKKESDFVDYETDLLIKEQLSGGKWIPRIIVEAKFRGSITTHDAITYSHKAFTHRQVHPYLRYGILIGDRKHYPLPGRLFRHGTQFDFMLSWKGADATEEEMSLFVNVLIKEVQASRVMQEIIYESRKKTRNHYTLLHKELSVK